MKIGLFLIDKDDMDWIEIIKSDTETYYHYMSNPPSKMASSGTSYIGVLTIYTDIFT